jgi:hypothetical protein
MYGSITLSALGAHSPSPIYIFMQFCLHTPHVVYNPLLTENYVKPYLGPHLKRYVTGSSARAAGTYASMASVDGSSSLLRKRRTPMCPSRSG